MDITVITDVKELKAMAYDALAQIEIQQRNLSVINKRISELENPPKAATTDPPATGTEG